MIRRSGMTLIEVMTAVTVGAAMMGIAVSLLYGLLELERDVRDQLRGRTSRSRLADHFRDDAHAATDFLALDEADAWRFVFDSERVVDYRAEPAGLLRVDRHGDEIVQRETFSWGHASTIEMQEETGPERLLSLSISPTSDGPKKQSARPFRVEAALGKDNRFLAEPNP